MEPFVIILSVAIILYELGKVFPSGITYPEMQLNNLITKTQTSLLKLGQECYATEQCNHTDPHATCMFSGTLDLRSMICRCRYGYIAEEIEGRKMCIPGNRYSLLGIPHLDSRDTVPIVMGCLAAGLAIFACCAGICQLISKKRYDRSQEPDHSAGPEQPFIAGACSIPLVIRNTSTRNTTDLPQDLPPSYEEAVKHPSPPPVYQEK